MVPLPALAVLLAAAAPRAAAQNMDDVTIEREVWKTVGWNDACGVAFSVLSYPKLGDALSSEPISTRVGTMNIPVGQEKAARRWTLEADGALSWDERAFKKAEAALRKGGYTRKGYPERIGDGPIGDRPLLAETILSTGTLSPRLKSGWPGPEWRWAGGEFNPLGTCALLAYESRENPRHYRFLLVRVYNPRARTDRAFAHATNAHLVFDMGNLEEASVEAETAAALAPELALARYAHAAMLALTGRQNEAVRELAEAVKLDRSLAQRARDDIDFRDLSGRDDFADIVR
ncbi:MAG: hypothetical protein HY079_10795 [Elusimicrobia bacterium]|nr:hypothetical protein [Elusimicrobiota bacterium]